MSRVRRFFDIFLDDNGDSEIWSLLGINPRTVRYHGGGGNSGDFRGPLKKEADLYERLAKRIGVNIEKVRKANEMLADMGVSEFSSLALIARGKSREVYLEGFLTGKLSIDDIKNDVRKIGIERKIKEKHGENEKKRIAEKQLRYLSWEIATELLPAIEKINKRSKEFGKRLIVIPNESFGLVYVKPIRSRLDAEGIEVVEGFKVPSTDNKTLGTIPEKLLSLLVDTPNNIVIIDAAGRVIENDLDKIYRVPRAFATIYNNLLYMVGYSPQARNIERFLPVRKDELQLYLKRLDDQSSSDVKNYYQLLKRYLRELTTPVPYPFVWNPLGLDQKLGDMPFALRSDAAYLPSANLDELPYRATVLVCPSVPNDYIPQNIRKNIGGECDPTFFDDKLSILETSPEWLEEVAFYVGKYEK